MKRKQWKDLNQTQRSLVVVAGSVEVVLTALALRDLARRPAAEIRGHKGWWALGCFVQPVGPVAYLTWGRVAAAD